MHITVVFALLSLAGLGSQQPAAPVSSVALDFEFFKTRVQPIFVAKRPGHARCIACHGSGTPLRLQPLSPGSTTWSDEESRKNFEAVRRVVLPGNANSRLLIHPLDEKAGGAFAAGSKAGTTADDYVRTTVVLAVVLFLVGISAHFPLRSARYGLIALGATLLVISVVLLTQLERPPG